MFTQIFIIFAEYEKITHLIWFNIIQTLILVLIEKSPASISIQYVGIELLALIRIKSLATRRV
jgi:hypothetical protein